MDLEIGHCYKLKSNKANGCVRAFEKKNNSPTFLLKCPIIVFVLEYCVNINVNANYYSLLRVLNNDQILYLYVYDIGSAEEL